MTYSDPCCGRPVRQVEESVITHPLKSNDIEISNYDEPAFYPNSRNGKSNKDIRNSLNSLYKKIKNNPVISVVGFLILTLIPTIWLFTNEIWPTLNPDPIVMTGEWNIAIAGFSNIGDESIDRDELTLIGSVFFNRDGITNVWPWNGLFNN